MNDELNSKATEPVKTAHCKSDIDYPYVACASCVRPIIPEGLKQPWQYPPAPNKFGGCPSWTDTIVKADPKVVGEGDPYLTASLASGGELK